MAPLSSRFRRWMTHQGPACGTFQNLDSSKTHTGRFFRLFCFCFLFPFSSLARCCSAAAVIWKVLADVAGAGPTPPCQLPHLERLSGGFLERGGLFFSMPAYTKKIILKESSSFSRR